MATFRQIPPDNVPPVSPARKYPNKCLFSNVSLSPKSWRNTVTSFNNSGNKFVETNIVTDFNKNVQETSKTTRAQQQSNNSNKIEKTTLKQTLPKLLCLKKSNSTSDENTFKTLNVNALRAENLSWNEYYNVNGNVTKSLDSFRSNRNGSCDDKSENASSSSKHDECLSNPNKNRKSFHQNVEDALSSLLWQPYEYQSKTTATSMTSRLVLVLFVLVILCNVFMDIVGNNFYECWHFYHHIYVYRVIR